MYDIRLAPSVSFKLTLIDFAFVFDMLALSEVLILFIMCVCVCVCCVVCCLFACFPFQFLYGWCLCRLQYCVCVKFIDAYLVKMPRTVQVPRSLSVTWYKCRLPSFMPSKMSMPSKMQSARKCREIEGIGKILVLPERSKELLLVCVCKRVTSYFQGIACIGKLRPK